MENLDRLCAKFGYIFADEMCKIDNFNAKKADVLITKALSVLQEQGLYAFLLFCESVGRNEKEGANKLKEKTNELLKTLNIFTGNNLMEELRKENGLAAQLDKLILAVQVLEKTLIYARYHAKAMVREDEKKQEVTKE